jgi:hypothetical protein
MRKWLWTPLLGALVLGAGIPGAGFAGTNPDAVIGLHLSAASGGASCGAFLPTSCNSFYTGSNTAGNWNVYVMIARYDTVGIAGAQFGIEYDDSPESGLVVHGWTSCADMEFATPGWPDSDSGTLITWEPMFNCQVDTLHYTPVLAGYFTVTATGVADFRIVPRPVDGKAKVADCLSAEDDITAKVPSRLGVITFGKDYGYNPCSPLVPVERTTWGNIKTLYER